MVMNLSTVSFDAGVSPDITYVALAATILPTDLQIQASAAGLCHLQVTTAMLEERCLVYVAALPHRLAEPDSERVYGVWLTAEQLAQALPWDRALQGIPTCEVREHLQALADVVEDDDPPPDLPPLGQTEPMQHETTMLLPLPELFVSCETVSEAAADFSELPLDGSPFRLNRWTRLVWLRAALAMVRRQMQHTRQAFYKLDRLLDKVISAQRQVRQALVSASAVYVGERLVGWRLRIAYPMREVLA